MECWGGPGIRIACLVYSMSFSSFLACPTGWFLCTFWHGNALIPWKEVLPYLSCSHWDMDGWMDSNCLCFNVVAAVCLPPAYISAKSLTMITIPCLWHHFIVFVFKPLSYKHYTAEFGRGGWCFFVLLCHYCVFQATKVNVWSIWNSSSSSGYLAPLLCHCFTHTHAHLHTVHLF